MSIDPTNHIGASAAGTPLAISNSTELARAARARAAQKRDASVERAAASAEGVGETDGESLRPGDRDADGRQPWRFPPRAQPDQAAHGSPPSTAPGDASEEPPHQIDLCG